MIFFSILIKPDESCPASQCGLTAWRILSGYPHYNLIEDEGTKLIKVIIASMNPFTLQIYYPMRQILFSFCSGEDEREPLSTQPFNFLMYMCKLCHGWFHVQ